MLRVKQTLHAKQEGEGEMEPLADEEFKELGAEWKEQISLWSISFTLPRQMKLFQQKNRSCFGCKSPNPSHAELPERH